MMLLPRAVKIYFATEPTNLRKSFDGLANEVRQTLRRDPLSGHVFIFLNRRKSSSGSSKLSQYRKRSASAPCVVLQEHASIMTRWRSLTSCQRRSSFASRSARR